MKRPQQSVFSRHHAPQDRAGLGLKMPNCALSHHPASAIHGDKATSRSASRRGIPVIALIALAWLMPALLGQTPQAQAQQPTPTPLPVNITYASDVPGSPNNTSGDSVIGASEQYALTIPDANPASGVISPTASAEDEETAILTDAISSASDGATITLRGGTWRVGQIALTKQVTIRAAQNERVIFDGAERVTAGWTDTDGGINGPIWAHDTFGTDSLGNAITYKFDQVDPIYRDPVANTQGNELEMVFVGGKALVQAPDWTGSALPTTTSQVPANIFKLDRVRNKIYINATTSPNGRTSNIVEITRYDRGITVNGTTNVIFQGLNFRRYAGEGGAVRLNTPDSVIDRCSFFWNARYGLVTTATGGSVRRGNYVSNGAAGIRIFSGSTSVRGNYIAYNNAEGLNRSYDSAGIKVTNYSGDISDNFVERNKGTGIWLDIDCHKANVYRNYVQGGTPYAASTPTNGIFVEVSGRDGSGAVFGNTVAFNLVTDAGAGLQLANSSTTRIWNNTVYLCRTALYMVDTYRDNHPGEFLRSTDIRNNIFANGTFTSSGGGDALVNATLGSFQTASAATISNFNYNVYRTGTNTPPNIILWRFTLQGATTAYSSLTNFPSATGFEGSGQVFDSSTPALFTSAPTDFRPQIATNPGAGLPVSGFLNNGANGPNPFLTDALNRSSLISAAKTAFAAPPTNSSAPYRGAFKPTVAPALTTMSAPSGGTG